MASLSVNKKRMKSRLNQLLHEIKQKKQELFSEYEKIKYKYEFHFDKGRIRFTEKRKKYNKTFKEGIFKYILSAQVRHIISMPFIYMMIVPALILDLFLTVFQHTCFRLYRIPLVERKEYITFDRKHLDYLNWIEKLNCLYCSYVNGLFSYAVEIGGRTEKYWCPIKHAKKLKTSHDWQEFFADYGDPEGFKKVYNSNVEYYKRD